jgi:hypothetical protein
VHAYMREVVAEQVSALLLDLSRKRPDSVFQ